MEERWIGFWGHIDDLRQTLVKTLIIIGFGFIILLSFYQPILHILTTTSWKFRTDELIVQPIQQVRVSNPSSKIQLFKLPNDAWVITDSSPLRQKGSLYYRLMPQDSLVYEQSVHPSLLIMGPIEGLLLVFKICFWLSLALTAPLWGWVWLKFILPGLKTQEKAILLPFLGFSLIGICLGVLFAYHIVLPVANQYLTVFNHSIGQNAWTLTHYMNYVLLLCLGNAIASELGLLLLMLVHFRILSPEWLIRKRRYMIVLAFILGALLTPPDVLTQLLLAFPLIGLYEVAILYAKWRQRSVELLRTNIN